MEEQVMQIAQVLSGYTLGGADMLRRAMGKKKPEEMGSPSTPFFFAPSSKMERCLAISSGFFLPIARRSIRWRTGDENLRPGGEIRRVRI
jgi:hypothetical protein